MSAAAKRRYAEGRNTNLKIGATGRRSEDTGLWKGDAASRGAKHLFVNRRSPKTGECARCGQHPSPITYQRLGRDVTREATAWANISGEYRREDPSDWVELCFSCHSKMDGIVVNLGPYANRPISFLDHGTRNRYEVHGCRCSECRAANAARHKAWVDSKKH